MFNFTKCLFNNTKSTGLAPVSAIAAKFNIDNITDIDTIQLNSISLKEYNYMVESDAKELSDYINKHDFKQTILA